MQTYPFQYPVTRNPYIIRPFVCLLTLLFMHYGFGQDTSSQALHPFNIKPTTDFDQRFYYTPGERQNVWGYRLGVLINDRYKLGIGGYYMNQQKDLGVVATPITRTNGEPVSISKRLYLGTIYYEPYLYRQNWWESSLVLETGYGRTVNTAVDGTDGKTLQHQNALLVPLGAGISINLKLPALFKMECFRWIGVNAMAGYRTILYQQDKQYSYAGLYWSLSGAVFLDRVFDDFHTWKRQRTLNRDKKIIRLSY